MYGHYTENSALLPPSDIGSPIWRYLTFTKFVSLIAQKSLFFSNISALKDDDPFEGTIPSKNEQVYQELLNDDDPIWNYTISTKEKNVQEEIMYCSVNCWHINVTESVAMWKLYLARSEGVAIRSTFRRLSQCFIENHDEQAMPIYIGRIKYTDYSQDFNLDAHPFHRITHKDSSFSHENELRAIISFRDQASTANNEDREKMKSGVNISVNLEVLIEHVILPPVCPKWVKELVKSLLAQYHVNVPIQESKLRMTIK